MIELKNICKSFDDAMVIKDLSLVIEKENFVSIVGKSGSGKTTLLNMIGTLDFPDSGIISVDNINISKFSQREIAEYRNRKIGFVFQSFFLEPSFDVFHNVAVPLYISGEKDIQKRVEEVLKLVGMNDYIKKKVSKLSGGEQQRVCIARAIVNNPEIILADEPCGNLDSTNSAIIIDLLKTLAENGKKVVLVTHDMDDARKSERIVTLGDGMIMSDELL
ncbi:MAG: ABC transporter ATP-binding protein [Oscillospiraceae bacterium]|nr:ABC transporter ATP-binding protein [Oscillospiraceae bacterium]